MRPFCKVFGKKTWYLCGACYPREYMRDTIIAIAAALVLLLSALTLPGCGHRHRAVAPYYEISPGVRLPLNNSGENPRVHLVLSADDTGTWLKLNGQKMTMAQLKAALHQQISQHPRAVMIISVSKDGKFVALFQQALNAAQEANPKELWITTTPTPASGKSGKIRPAVARP